MPELEVFIKKIMDVNNFSFWLLLTRP